MQIDPTKVDVPEEHWDSAFAPSSLVSVITTVDSAGQVNAAAFGTCTRVGHDPVYLSFAVGAGKDTYLNVLARGEFVVNTPGFRPEHLLATRVTGLDFPRGVDETGPAGLHVIPSTQVEPPRIAEFNRHFECVVEWAHRWRDRMVVCGRVVAVSADPGIVGDDGLIDWDRTRPFHFCGWPYEDAFVPMDQVTHVPMAWTGPEATAGERPIPPVVDESYGPSTPDPVRSTR